MNLFAHYKKKISEIIQGYSQNQGIKEDFDLDRMAVEAPREEGYGDLSCNAAMVFAKPMGMSPKRLAEALLPEISSLPGVSQAAIAGVGFINLVLEPSVWQDHLEVILRKKLHYGDSEIGQGQTINVEYVSANPTGPMHVGHCRNAVFGDTLASLFQKTGFKVCREYYINDAGAQIKELGRSIYLRYQEALGCSLQESDFKEGMYPGEYLKPLGAHIAKTEGKFWLDKPENQWIDHFQQKGIAAMMAIIRKDLESLGVVIDTFTSEKDILSSGLLDKLLTQLEQQGDIYQGVLTPPKGHVVEDWEERPQTLFRATAYGDDVDRPLKKSDGSWTYFAGDIAYHKDKFDRGFAHMINVFGADHGGYLKRLQASVKAVTKGKANLEIKETQLVNLYDRGQPIKMSKRAGTFVSLRDVVDRVGRDATRFMMLTRRHDVSLDFDFDKVLEKSRENPLFYVQYAHARACSVLRHGQELWPRGHENCDPHLLTDPAELTLMKKLAQWPQQVESAMLMREPHRIVNYLLEVAAVFHGLWNKGKEDIQLRFIDPQLPELSRARLGLNQAVAHTLANGLTLLGIDPLQEMR